MKWMINLIVLALVFPVGVVCFNVGYNLADSQWEYKTQMLQEKLENFEMRERVLYSLPTNGKEAARPLSRA